MFIILNLDDTKMCNPCTVVNVILTHGMTRFIGMLAIISFRGLLSIRGAAFRRMSW